MLEELRQILAIVKDLPHLVMWVLAGLLLYKIVYIGSIFGVVKIAIEKIHNWAIKEKVVTHQWKYNDYFISEETKIKFEKLLDKITRLTVMNRYSDNGIERLFYSTSYVTSSNLDCLKEAIHDYEIKQQKLREEDEKRKQKAKETKV